MDAIPRLIGESENILDLNDDCLKEVFAHLDPEELAVVADVCVRFRQNTIHSASLKCKKLKLSSVSSLHEYSIMRNFGAFIESIKVKGSCGEESRPTYQKHVIELLSRYCVGKPICLWLNGYDITAEIAILMMPLLSRVKKLRFCDTPLSGSFINQLAIWAPELCELNLLNSLIYEKVSVMGCRSLLPNFPNLKSLTVQKVSNVRSNDIKEFLKQNPQLENIELSLTNIDDNVIQSIAMYVPKIQHIVFRSNCTVHRDNIKYFGRLSELKTLILVTNEFRYYSQSVVHEIASANIALEFLSVYNFDLRYNAALFMEGITKLKQLKTLVMRSVYSLTASHVIDICKNLKALSEISFHGVDLPITAAELLMMIQNAEKLTEFYFSSIWVATENEPTIIDVNTFEKLVGIVKRRREQTPLELQLPKSEFSADIPAEVITAASDFLTLELRDY